MLDLFDGYDWDATSAAESLPRTIVLASAGSGKTFRISSAIISLLAKGGRADECLASTFTRKAAGEILDRVLLRIADAALDPVAAKELAGHAEIDAQVADPSFWCSLLERVAGELHRMNIGTLDAFFVQTALSFAHELGMPTRWTIADEPTGDRIRSLALQDVLQHTDRSVLLEIVRGVNRSSAGRSVHEQLLRQVRLLMSLHHALDPETRGHWMAFADAAGGATPVDEHERIRLADRVAALPRPVTGKGTEHKGWAGALVSLERNVRMGDWAEMVRDTLVQRARQGGEYRGIAVSAALRDIVADAYALARRDVAIRMHVRSQALHRLARIFAEAVDRRRAEHGAYEFDDITRLLGGADPVGARPDMYYRLDMRARHILLDEFQDTSLPQWEALQPVVDELMSGHRTERAAVIVADPKQSIYGWRGGSPDLVELVRDRYALEPARLTESWRSSAVILDFVNQVFDRLAENPVWGDDELCRTVAQEWHANFQRHAPRKDLWGHVRITVGPEDEDGGEQRPRLMRHAAEQVAELHRAMPAASIAVLTRTNAAVARIMLELRQLGVHASEEGGNPLTDAAPVSAVLALLRMADHPGNTVARYHVARSPLGELLGYTDHTDGNAAVRIAHQVRSRLLEEGYGAVVTGLARSLMERADDREQRRLAQLGELAFRYEPGATLRPTDFVHFVRRERVEDPTAAAVRVMTVHQAKGLEFDIVVLPQLDVDLVDMRYVPLLGYRPAPGARVTRAFPWVKKDLRGLFPEIRELHAASEDAQRNVLRDSLSSLYVALTRARHALHIVVKPDGTGRGKTGARLIRSAACDGAAAVEGAVLIEQGSPDWHVHTVAQRDPESAGGGGITPPPPGQLTLRSGAPRSRSLPRRVPSELEGGARIDVANLLRVSGTAAARRGTLVHRWMEDVSWLDAGLPDEQVLLSAARAVEPDADPAEVRSLLGTFREWCAVPAVLQALTRPQGNWEVMHEVPFLREEQGIVLEGFIDRVELRRDGNGIPDAARVIDFKTDALGDDVALSRERVSHYAPQLAAYRRAVAAMFRLPITAVDAEIVFLEAGIVAPVRGDT